MASAPSSGLVKYPILPRPHQRPTQNLTVLFPRPTAQAVNMNRHTVSAFFKASQAFPISPPTLQNVPSSCPTRRRRPSVPHSSLAQTPAAPDGAPPFKEFADKLSGSARPPLSDMVWAAVGAFSAMGMFAYLDKVLAPHGLSASMGSVAAVCMLLFAAPSSPSSQKWNVLFGHAISALVGVIALTLLGPGWLTKACALSAAVVCMQFTGSLHPPAAGVTLAFIDMPKFHHLNWWFVLFPGLFGCIWLLVLQEVIDYLKANFKF